jgi:hypothetical protein
MTSAHQRHVQVTRGNRRAGCPQHQAYPPTTTPNLLRSSNCPLREHVRPPGLLVRLTPEGCTLPSSHLSERDKSPIVVRGSIALTVFPAADRGPTWVGADVKRAGSTAVLMRGRYASTETSRPIAAVTGWTAAATGMAQHAEKAAAHHERHAQGR